MPVYRCKSSCHSCPALHRRTGPLAPRDNHPLAKGHWFFTDRCLLSTALTLSVPCRPMPMISSVEQVAAYQTPSPPHKRRRTDTGGTQSTPGALHATQYDAPDPPASGAAT